MHGDDPRPIRDDDHRDDNPKSGHPTMAGAVLMIGTVVVIFIAALLSSLPR